MKQSGISKNISSKHSEAIISENRENIDKFLKIIDASSVYANTSTAFTDGAQFGLGAEIGISTQKLHARGPMALEALTSYKWIINGSSDDTYSLPSSLYPYVSKQYSCRSMP